MLVIYASVGGTERLLLIDRFHPQQRRAAQARIDAGELRKVDELALLEPEQLQPLAFLSMRMFGMSGLFFVVLNLLSYSLHDHRAFPPVTVMGFIIWLVCNIIGYIIILPIHEAIHAFFFAFWGGRPHFGAKLPLALYCGAKNQLFPRTYYIWIGSAPLVVITAAGILLTIFAPTLAFYTLLATVGNVAGAAGDVIAVQRLRLLEPQVMVEDTETGYTAWAFAPIPPESPL